MNNYKIEGTMVTVVMMDGSSFSYRSEFIRDGKIIDYYEFGNELREKIYGN